MAEYIGAAKCYPFNNIPNRNIYHAALHLYIVKCSTVQYSRVQQSTVQQSLVQYSAVPQWSNSFTSNFSNRIFSNFQRRHQLVTVQEKFSWDLSLYKLISSCLLQKLEKIAFERFEENELDHCCTALYCSALYYTLLHCTLLYSTILYCTTLNSTVLYYTLLYIYVCRMSQ